MVTIWFEPHSITTDNEQHIASGWNDADLSEDGKQKAELWTTRCKKRGIEVIFCSDTQRAVKSAMPAARDLHLPVYVDSRLRECNYGDFTQKPKEVVDAQRLKHIKEPFPGGESYEQCLARVKSFLDELMSNFSGRTVMLVGHRATHYGLDVWINKMRIEDAISREFVYQPGWKYEL